MGIQKEFENIGKYGCYLLCLLKLAGIEEDVLKYYRLFLKNNWIDEECYVKNPAAIMNCLTGYDYSVSKSNKADNNARYMVLYWYNPRTKLHHFTLPNWDPLGNSTTRAQGEIESYRLFYRR